MANKQIKGLSTSFTIREMLIKTKKIYHAKFTTTAKSKKTDTTKY